MSEPIFDPDYWQQRLQAASELHHSIFRCPLDRWQRIEAKHRDILASVVRRGWSILDAGCGYGRLLTLMPPLWAGEYYGVDLSPDFITEAQRLHPGKAFIVSDLRRLPIANGRFDLAVCISIRPMVIRNAGELEWITMEAELRRVAKRILYLEYDETDNGELT